jgi:IclR family transcriptional regulator, acetate operon repressor
MEPSEKNSENVRAVNRALDVLLAFTSDDYELTATELLRRVELSRPTLYRLLYTLETKGFIASVGDPQRFRLGPAVARLSHVWNATLDVAVVAEPFMRKLWLETRETVALFVEQGDMRLCLAEMPSPQPLNFKRGVGYTERIARGASGRAILAFTPEVDARLERYAQDLDMNLKKLRMALDETRVNGYSVSRDELIEGAAAVAAPFFDGKGIAGSLAIFGPAARVGEKRIGELGKLVMAEAANLSEALGAQRAAA